MNAISEYQNNFLVVIFSDPDYLIDAIQNAHQLDNPEPLARETLQKMRILRSFVGEYVTSSWWEMSRGRNYHLAVAPSGQICWIFHDLIEDQFYLQGYFLETLGFE